MTRKHVLTALVIWLAVFMTGCATAPPDDGQAQPVVTADKLQECYAFCDRAFKDKVAFLQHIQLATYDGYKVVQQLMAADNPARALRESDNKDLSEVYSLLHLAGLEFNLYFDKKEAKHYTKGTTYYNQAEDLYNKIK